MELANSPWLPLTSLAAGIPVVHTQAKMGEQSSSRSMQFAYTAMQTQQRLPTAA
jgi:hypothetical protein